MVIWRSAVFAAAALAAGCSADIGAPAGGGMGTGAGSGIPTGSGGGGSKASGGTTSGGNAGTSGGSGGVSGGGPNCTPTVQWTSQIPRLTNAQYDRTIRDLLGVTNLSAANGVAPSTLLATDQSAGLTDLAWANYKDVADKIAAQVMADANLKQNFIKCTPAAGDNTCLHDTIVEFGRRAFRRTLTEAEIARFDKVVAAGPTITPTGAPAEVAQALLYMFLISPTFLQRAETTEASDGAGHFALSSSEIATRLSYMLWGTTPDKVLSDAADQNQLSTPEQIAMQANRMLQDPRARDMVGAFHQYYLLMGAEGRWGTANRDTSMFPGFKPTLVPLITDETLKFFDKIAFGGGVFQDYLTSNVAFVNKETAPLYGLDPSKFGTELTETTLDASRPGFLTRLGFLMNFASFTRTNPIYRGAFITKQVMGIHLDAPPPGAEQTPLPTGATLDTNRKQVEAQTGGDACKGCHHVYINPTGFVMEAFDAMGALRTTEANGVALDTTGDVTVEDGANPVHMSQPTELMAAIAASSGAAHQYAKKWVSYAYGREADEVDACTVDQITARMNGKYTVLNLVADLTQTQSFRVRAVEVSQ